MWVNQGPGKENDSLGALWWRFRWRWELWSYLATQSQSPAPESRRPAAQWHSVRRQDSVLEARGLNVLRRKQGSCQRCSGPADGARRINK